MMMQHRKIGGTKLGYKPALPAELSTVQRDRIANAQRKAEALREAHSNLVFMASDQQLQFERMSRWIVATCRTGTEQSVAEELKGNRITTWCPLEKFRKRPRRGLKPAEYHRPFFRGYLFCKVVPCHEAYAGLLCASRLTGLMGRDGIPFLMPEKLMAALMLGVRNSAEDQEDERLPVWQGARVIVRSGPFSDFEATVRRVLKNKWKAVVETTVFGHMTPIEIDIDSVELCD